MDNYEIFCTNCKYSEYDERYPDTIPSMIICHNKESEYHNKTNAWCGTCDSFHPAPPPPKRIIKEDIDIVAFAKAICRPLLWGYTDDELNKWRK